MTKQEKNTSPQRLSILPGAIARGLIHLLREFTPIALFFFLAFLIIFLMLKLFGERYAIEFSALTKAAVAALVIGKVIALLDWAQSGYRFDHHRPITLIMCKTAIYGLVVIALGIGEKIYHGFRETGSLQVGLQKVIANANLDRFFGIVLLITLVIGFYVLLQEIDRALGEGALRRQLFAIELRENFGFSWPEVNRLARLLQSHVQPLCAAWSAFHGYY